MMTTKQFVTTVLILVAVYFCTVITIIQETDEKVNAVLRNCISIAAPAVGEKP